MCIFQNSAFFKSRRTAKKDRAFQQGLRNKKETAVSSIWNCQEGPCFSTRITEQKKRLSYQAFKLPRRTVLLNKDYGTEQAARAWSPSVCESQWGEGKKWIYGKVFFAKNHMKVSAPTMGGWAKQWKRDLKLIKMNFGAKKFFWKKIFFLKNF